MDTDLPDTAPSDPARHAPDGASRRRLLGAGVVGLATSLFPQFARRAAASTPPPGGTDDSPPLPGEGPDSDGSTPPGGDNFPSDATTDASSPSTAAATTTSVAPKRPSQADLELLEFARSVELAAVELFDMALATDSFDDEIRPVIVSIREAHEAYAQSIYALLGGAPGTAFAGAIDPLGASFSAGSAADLAMAAHALEGTAVATHTDVIGALEGTDGAELLAAICVAEARHGTVLADIAGQTDLDLLLLSGAQSLQPTKG